MPRRARFAKSAWSVFLRIEELVLAASGLDAFEVAFSIVAARLFALRHGRPGAASLDGRSIEALLSGARHTWPELGVLPRLPLPESTLCAVVELLGHAGLDGDAEGVDALFEQLVTRVGKGQKGQFFTPRHVVDFAIGALDLRAGERFVDPACGSGAFPLHARKAADVDARGYDIDLRAVRVAKLLAVATGEDPGCFDRRDSLSTAARRAARVDAIATNPPFAGHVEASGFEVGTLGGARVERDALFLERCLASLVPGGRLAIVLPHSKVASPSWRPLREWLRDRARVYAVVSLPPETFLPHTQLRTVLMLAKKRSKRASASPHEKVFLAVSARAGTSSDGEPVFVGAAGLRPSWRERDHDLGELSAPLRSFLDAEGFAPAARKEERELRRTYAS